MAVSRNGPVGLRVCSRLCEAPAVFLELTRALDTRVARHLRRAFLAGDHDAIANASIDPTTYSNPDLFWRDYQAVSMMSKYPKLQLGIDTAAVALKAFSASEIHCRSTNLRLRLPYATPSTGVTGESLLMSARHKIRKLLPDFSWDLIEPWMTFSGGSTTRLKRTHGDAYYKLSGKPHVTHRAALLACCAIERSPSWSARVRDEFGLDPSNWVTVVPGSRITTVPKNAKTDRVIAIEPDMNMYLQKGFGGFLRCVLKRVGINLDDQTVNQLLAQVGSRLGNLATLDLKAASDTVCIELVRLLLPSDWFEAMDMVRSHIGVLPSGDCLQFQKFSSMGNGFTFELESMIFWALSAAVVDQLGDGDHQLSVYGDDIIVPTAAAGWLIELLEYVGFETNTKKSFVTGPFRESCGKHYFNGVDVTPFYIKEEVNTTARQYWLANSIRRWAARPLDGTIADPRFFRVWQKAVLAVPKRDRVFIPENIGDCGLLGTFEEALPRRGMNNSWVLKVLSSGVGRKTEVRDDLAYLRALLHGCVGDSLSTLLCDRERKWSKRVNMTITQWDDGPFWPVIRGEQLELV